MVDLMSVDNYRRERKPGIKNQADIFYFILVGYRDRPGKFKPTLDFKDINLSAQWSSHAGVT